MRWQSQKCSRQPEEPAVSVAFAAHQPCSTCSTCSTPGTVEQNGTTLSFPCSGLWNAKWASSNLHTKKCPSHYGDRHSDYGLLPTMELQLWTGSYQSLASFVAFILGKVLDEAGCKVFCLLFPLASAIVSVAWVEDV